MRLNELLAERQITASRVHIDTKISRSTLSGIINNTNKMLQMETLNVLCSYLGIQPGDFFEHTEFDMEFFAEINDHDAAETIKDNSNIENLYVDIYANKLPVTMYCKMIYSNHTDTLSDQFIIPEFALVQVEDYEPGGTPAEISWKENASNKISKAVLDLTPGFQIMATNKATAALSTELTRVINAQTGIDMTAPVGFKI
jgi:DNA-binding Xre family transcriptional regulator